MISSSDRQRIIDWLNQRKKIHAIKFVQQNYKVRLTEATQLVQAIDEENSPGSKPLSIDPVRVVGAVFTGLGVVFTVVVVALFWSDRSDMQESHQIKGTVESLDYTDNGTAAPVIKYWTNGEKKILVGTVWSNPPSYEIGEEVELLVAPNGKVTINSFFERFFMIGLFAFLAVIFGGIGVLVLIFLKD